MQNNDLLGTSWTATALQVGAASSNGDGTETVTFRDDPVVLLLEGLDLPLLGFGASQRSSLDDWLMRCLQARQGLKAAQSRSKPPGYSNKLPSGLVPSKL